jgi:ABC-2 type transport system permease protein
MNIVLFLLLQTYGGWVVQGVTREKASRVVEVLLSTITARQLLFGKVTGIGFVALVHATVLVTSALVATRVVGLDVFDGFRLGDVALGGVWFLVGYALYCSAFAAAGALCSRAEDAQGAALPITLPMLAGYLVAFSAAGGVSPVLWILAFFPPTAVLCMPVLWATGDVPAWAMLLSMVLTLATAVGIALVAARIFERSVLRTKRVSWRAALTRAA